MHFRLNLASRTYLDRRSVQRWLLLVGGLLLGVLAINLLYGYRNLQQLRQVDLRIAEIDSKLASRRDQPSTDYSPEAFAKLKTQIGAVNQLLEADSFRWTALLGRMEELLPDDVAIRSLRPNYRDRSLQVSAVARDTVAMSEFLDVLLASEDMNQAYLHNHSMVEQPTGDDLVQFSITIQEAF